MPQVPVNGGVGTPTQSWCHSRGFQTTHRALFLHSPGGTLLELEGLNPLYRWTNQGPERNDWLSGSHSKSKSPQILGPLPAEPRHMIPEHKKCPRHEQQIPGLQKSPAIPRKWNSAFTDEELLKVSGLGQRVPGFLLPARGLWVSLSWVYRGGLNSGHLLRWLVCPEYSPGQLVSRLAWLMLTCPPVLQVSIQCHFL